VCHYAVANQPGSPPQCLLPAGWAALAAICNLLGSMHLLGAMREHKN